MTLLDEVASDSKDLGNLSANASNPSPEDPSKTYFHGRFRMFFISIELVVRLRCVEQHELFESPPSHFLGLSCADAAPGLGLVPQCARVSARSRLRAVWSFRCACPTLSSSDS